MAAKKAKPKGKEKGTGGKPMPPWMDKAKAKKKK